MNQKEAGAGKDSYHGEDDWNRKKMDDIHRGETERFWNGQFPRVFTVKRTYVVPNQDSRADSCGLRIPGTWAGHCDIVEIMVSDDERTVAARIREGQGQYHDAWRIFHPQ